MTVRERVERTLPSTGLPRAATTVVAVVAGFAVASVLLLLLGANPVEAWTGIIRGSVGSVSALTDTARQTVPVALIAIGVAISFRAGLWNAGGNGQFLVGATAAAVVGIQLNLPFGLHVLVTLAVASVAGAAFSLLPGVLREYRGASEILTTLMLNYVGALLASYVISGPLSATFSPSTVQIEESARVPLLRAGIHTIHPGIFVVAAVALGIGLLMKRSLFGLRVESIGANQRAAELSGVPGRRTRLQVFGIAGALAGLSGGLQVSAVHHSLVDGMSPNYGFTAIVAALLGGLGIRGALIGSVAMSALLVGGQALQRTSDFSISAVYVIQGALLVTLLAAKVIGRSDRSWR